MENNKSKNYVVMNKRYDIDSWIAIIIFLVSFAGFVILPMSLSISDYRVEWFFLSFLSALLVPSSIKAIIKLYKLPVCKAAEIIDDNLIIYGYEPHKGLHIKHQIDIRDINEYQINHVRSYRARYYSYMDIFTVKEHFVIKGLDRRTKKPRRCINYDVFKVRRILKRALKENGMLHSKLPDKRQNKYAKAMFENYLADILDERPLTVRYIVRWFTNNNRRFYVLKFKRNAKDKTYLLGVNGGYLDSKTRANSFSITEFASYNKKTAVNDAKKLVENHYAVTG